MIVAGTESTDAADTAVTHVAAELLGGILGALGIQGVAVLLAVGAIVLTFKSKQFRGAEWKAIKAACRSAYRALRWIVARIRGRVGVQPTKDERRLLARLQSAHWKAHAEGRGLAGTLTARPKLTDAGIVAAVRLDGTWTVGKLRAAEENVRALLGARTSLRIEVAPGKRGGWAELTIRTRSAVDQADMRWVPGRIGIGLDMHTGRTVEIPLNTRLLLAGSSGAGKSVSLRPALAELCADPFTAVVMVDLKRVEGALWKTRARIARTAEDVEQVAAELCAEMMERLTAAEDIGSASWSPTTARPRIIVLVDEGAEVSAVAKDAIPAFESLARMGRAAEIHLWWCTQKPTMSGASAGIPPQIAAQMDVRLCLKVSTATEVRTVLGEDASAGGWDAHTLPKPGVLMIRGTGRGPAPVKVWYMDDATVRTLPPAPIWGRGHDDGQAPPPTRLTKVLVPAVPDSEERVLAALADGAVQVPALVEQTGLSRATVNRLLSALLDTGRVHRADRGRYALAGPGDAA